MKNKVSQMDFITKYMNSQREKFNPELFERNEDDIVEELKKTILSCQRNKKFVIRVDGFEVVEDYNEIYRILEQNENISSRKGSKPKSKKENQYSYINLRESDIKLLIVKYYLRGKDVKKKEIVEEYLNVLIAIPRYVNKYYFRISGKLCSPMWQVTDGSTYNNMTSTNITKPSITLKSYMPPIQVFKGVAKLIEDDKGEMECTVYDGYIFSKYFPCTLYILAKLGLYKAMNFLEVGGYISITQTKINDPDVYNFRSGQFYITVPKIFFDSNLMIQNIVGTLYHYVCKTKDYNELFTNDFWRLSLGGEFIKNGTVDKGEALLDSIESIYDITEKEKIRLPIEKKETVYHILRWIMQEFIALKDKSNLNMKYKKIGIADYIASLYSMKVCNALYTRISKISGKKGEVTINDLKKVVRINPMFLLQSISKCNLVNYRDMVNDMDGITALAYTNKRIVAASSKKKDSSAPEIYKYIHPSQMGRIDEDSSHKSDPGMSGNLCPMAEVKNGYFSDFKEPDEWDKNFAQLIDNYKELKGLKDLFTFKRSVLNDHNIIEEEKEVDESLNELDMMVPMFRYVDKEKNSQGTEIPLEESGTLVYKEG